MTGMPPPQPRQGGRALDWFNFLIANEQTGFGAFVAVFLTSAAWTQGQIGLALAVGTVASILTQVPAGALVDAAPDRRRIAALACLGIGASALLIALWPVELSVWLAQVLHSLASSLMVPAIAALSLGLVGHAALGERLGRNARYAAIGSAVGALLMGLCGTYVSEGAVFYLTAAITVPAVLALRGIPSRLPAAAEATPAQGEGGWRTALGLLAERRLLVFALAVGLFHLSNAAQLPLMATEATAFSGSYASLVIAACILLPQLLLSAIAPAVGRMAERRGRRPLMVLCFAAVPLRAALLAGVDGPFGLILVQALDGISAAGFGVLLPLVTADLTRGTGRLNLCLGLFGLAGAAGAALSTTLAGLIAEAAGTDMALLALAGAGVACVAAAGLLMPETRGAPARLTRPAAAPPVRAGSPRRGDAAGSR